ncbi:MAG: hypothetical protein QOJ78_1507 [Pseudonocardiales bacterium]|nr:hypothetical protein [Pseudonocardiales bacterium]
MSDFIIKTNDMIKITMSPPTVVPMIAGPVPDPVLTKPGTCQFITTNMTVQAG